jgi:GT2 family glycosyltransferase
MVICNKKIDKAQTAISLTQACINNPDVFSSFKLVIYDNSPNGQTAPPEMPFECEYKHDPDNGGLAAAYNYALQRAAAENYGWLLLFDDDTSLPVDFIEKFNDISRMADSSVVAIVPKAHYRGRYFSPYKVLFGGIHRPVDRNFVGICDFEVSAVGSATMLRTSFMQELGGFNKTFWLDCLDSWIFHSIHLKGKKVYIAPVVIEHELSILDYDKFMSEKKYLNTLKYEALFMRSYKTKPENFFYLLRLIKRSLTLFFTVKNKKYSLITLQHLLALIFHPEKCLEITEQKHPTLK